MPEEGYISDLDQTCHSFPVEDPPSSAWVRILSFIAALCLVVAVMPFGLLWKYISKRRG
jgi:hypothetical protein